ncbi:MAG: glycine cleavage system protein GcvH [Myxococcota bacterium]
MFQSGEMRFTRDHEWVRVDGDAMVMGITVYAAQQLGDIVFVELPDTGRTFEAEGELCVVESVKAASEVYAPISGKVVGQNTALRDEPTIVNDDPEGAGWMVKFEAADPNELNKLLTREQYDELLQGIS